MRTGMMIPTTMAVRMMSLALSDMPVAGKKRRRKTQRRKRNKPSARRKKADIVMGMPVDITGRKDTEDRIRDAYENIIHALSQSAIVAITDKNGIIQSVNDKFTELSKYSKEELIGHSHSVVNSGYHPKEFFRKMWRDIRSGKVWRGEIKNRAKDGTYYWVDTTITPRVDSNGRIIQFTAIHHDITRRKELERLKDEFVEVASHELRTPVTSLKGYVHILKKRIQANGDRYSGDTVEKIDRQLDKLNELIADLLDITRIDSGKLQLRSETFNIDELVQETVLSVQTITDNHPIDITSDADIPVYGDRERISQVLTNLLLNAVKYSPRTGKIIVTVVLGDTHVTVSVRDFGVGIRKDQQKNLFKRFYRVKGGTHDTYPGLGLGLYISAELVRRHNGRIWVDSEEGKGSTFSFTIPRPEQRNRAGIQGSR